MRREAKGEDVYARVDRLCGQLRTAGLNKEALLVHQVLHEVAWTTSSELLGELESAFRSILRDPGTILPLHLRMDMEEIVSDLENM